MKRCRNSAGAGLCDCLSSEGRTDRERGLLGAEGHLVQHDGAEVALVLGRAAEVEELALRTPSTKGNGRTQCAAATSSSAAGRVLRRGLSLGKGLGKRVGEKGWGKGSGKGVGAKGRARGGEKGREGIAALRRPRSTAGAAAEARFYLRSVWLFEGTGSGPGGPAGRSTSWPRPTAAPTWRRWRGGTGRRARRGC